MNFLTTLKLFYKFYCTNNYKILKGKIINITERNKDIMKKFETMIINSDGKVTNDIAAEGMIGIFRGIGAM